MIDSERIREALLAARSVIAGAESEIPGNEWWGVQIARRHLEVLATAAAELVSVAGKETAEPDSAVDAALREAAPTGLEQGHGRPTHAAPRMTTDDVGDYYLYDDGSIWQLVSYSDQPTATLERVDRPIVIGPLPRRNGVVGALIFEGFRKLVPEGP